MNLKNRLRSWLGININEDRLDKLDELYSGLTSIGVDVSPTRKSPHTVIVLSKLNGGQVRIIDTHFGTLKELEEFCKWLKEKYRAENNVVDRPWRNSIFDREILGDW